MTSPLETEEKIVRQVAEEIVLRGQKIFDLTSVLGGSIDHDFGYLNIVTYIVPHLESRHVVSKLVAALWPAGGPPADWVLDTPLGNQYAALCLDFSQPVTWSYREAARVLERSNGTIQPLLLKGAIARHPDGGIVPASVVFYKRRRDA